MWLGLGSTPFLSSVSASFLLLPSFCPCLCPRLCRLPLSSADPSLCQAATCHAAASPAWSPQSLNLPAWGDLPGRVWPGASVHDPSTAGQHRAQRDAAGGAAPSHLPASEPLLRAASREPPVLSWTPTASSSLQDARPCCVEKRGESLPSPPWPPAGCLPHTLIQRVMGPAGRAAWGGPFLSCFPAAGRPSTLRSFVTPTPGRFSGHSKFTWCVAINNGWSLCFRNN